LQVLIQYVLFKNGKGVFAIAKVITDKQIAPRYPCDHELLRPFKFGQKLEK
jgi:hypothetical protein